MSANMSQPVIKLNDPIDDQHSLLYSLFDDCGFGVIVVDPDMKVVLWNKWMREASGIPCESAIDKEILCVFPELKKSRLPSLLANAFSRGVAGMLSHALNKAPLPLYDPQNTSREIKHAIYIKPIVLDNKQRFCVIQVKDVTGALQREKQLRDYADRSQQAKIEAENLSALKSGFISTVSHELRTPLTSIKGSLGLISGEAVGGLPTKTALLIDIAQKNTERLLLLINDILDVEKIESGRLEFNFLPVDVFAFLQQAIEFNTGYAHQHNVTLRLSADETNMKVYADADRLMQVMNNLISNAAKFSPDNSCVEIATMRHGGQVRISVTDNGPGIPKEFQPSLFDKFTQADNSTTRKVGGTGLGMSISKGIVEKHNAELKFITEDNVGTTFYFDIEEWLDENRPDDGPRSHDTTDELKHILVFEDDEQVSEILRTMLEKQGYEVHVARQLQAITDLLNRQKPDAIIHDVDLLSKNDGSLYDELRKYSANLNIPVIIVSLELDGPGNELKGTAVGVSDWLNKPLDQGRLLAAIRRATSDDKQPLPHLLHVEDDIAIARFIRELLEDKVKITHCSKLAEAREILLEENFNTVLLDLGLPDGSGLDLLGYIQKVSPSTNAIVFSSQGLSPSVAASLKASLIESGDSSHDLLGSITSRLNRKNVSSG